MPAVAWGAGALVAAVPLAIIVSMAMNQHLPGTHWSLIGVVLLLIVIVFSLAMKALQAFVNWIDPD